jgi:hypothetical protein
MVYRGHAQERDDERTADEHDDPACTCDACERAGNRARARARRREARACGGLSSSACELLGTRWLDGDGKGGSVHMHLKAIDMGSLAQRALGDVFEQLERIASTGRDKCKFPLYTPPGIIPPEHRLERAEARKLIEYAERALDYARSHLPYLADGADDEPANDVAPYKRTSSASSAPLTVGTRVGVLEEAADETPEWYGEIVALTEHEAVVRHLTSGKAYTVGAEYLQSAPVPA